MNRCPTCGHKLRAPARARRVVCEGGCGRWWYYEGRGRPRRWCDRCYPLHRSKLRHGRAEPAIPLNAERGVA